jgi:prepilin-type N-terminal cleavage/methylation domain-containing protein
MTKNAFTLIELLVVITIITLLTSSWVIYFFRQVSSIQIASEIEEVVDIIDDLDSKIDNKKILDYNIYINKNSLWFTWSINNLWLNNSQSLNLNFTTWNWTITSNSGTVLKIYSWIKFQENKIIDSSWKYSYNFLKNTDSKILASLSWSSLNSIYINYYSPDNIIKNSENKLELININSKSDKSWTWYNNIIIKNLNWKKSIKWNTWWELNKIHLFFEREWVEKFVEIKK